jgi:DedD protein
MPTSQEGVAETPFVLHGYPTHMPFSKFRRGEASTASFAGSTVQVESVEVVRKRARHRLIGASVLVLAGVVVFPLLFDTQPRPVPVGIPIEIPGKDAVKPLRAPAQPAAAPSGDKKDARPAAVEGAGTPAAEMKSRSVVQVGAFADAAKAHETRLKMEKAGFKTYTQVVETPEGQRTRIRVGPFATKEEAEKMGEKIRALNLEVAILTF